MKQPLKIVVVGGNAAGPAAAARAKRVSPLSEVLMLETGNYISTGTCEMPYVLSGKIKDYEDIIFFTPESFFRKKGVKVLLRHTVESIERKKKLLVIRDTIDNRIHEVGYDKLILATGSLAKKLPQFADGLKNVFTLKSINDLITIGRFINDNKPRNAIIIGAGYIGIEIAEALKIKGLNVTIFDSKELPMPSADPIFSKKFLDIFEREGIRFFGLQNNLEPYIKNESVVSLKSDNKYFESDLIISAAGFIPNSSLARDAGILTGKSGGIITDGRLRTNDPHIFSAGDVNEVINFVTNKHEFMPLATNAYQQGHTAGENASGGNLLFENVVKNISVKIFNEFYCSVGLNLKEALENNLNAESVMIEPFNLIKVMPESRKIVVNLIFEKVTKRILGGAFLGGAEVSGYADLLSAMIKLKQNVDVFERINFNYTPPLSPFSNPFNLIGRISNKH